MPLLSGGVPLEKGGIGDRNIPFGGEVAAARRSIRSTLFVLWFVASRLEPLRKRTRCAFRDRGDGHQRAYGKGRRWIATDVWEGPDTNRRGGKDPPAGNPGVNGRPRMRG